MSLYETSDEQRVRLYQVAAKMAAAGLPASFISDAVELGSISEGVYELMALWEQLENDPAEREQVIADLHEAIEENDEKPRRVVERPKLNYKDLDDVAKRVLAFKAELRKKVDRWGGISRLAEATGMPQPSLSRFFNTASMPRRTTLYKIAKAMDLPETEIVFDWVA